MIDHAGRLREAVRALAIHSPHVFSWFGRRNERARPRRVTSDDPFEWLRLSVKWQLYSGFYCRGIARPTLEAGSSDQHVTSKWIAGLSDANRGSGCADEGWSVVRDRERSAIVSKGGLTLEVPHERLERRQRSRAVTVVLPNELVGMSPGFYIAVADKPFSAGEPSFRVYWNLRASSAFAFVRHATGLLNRKGMTFRLKVAADPRRFDRCDSGVLYFRKRDRSKAYSALESLLETKAIELNPLVPAFTKPIAPGLAVAEQPPQAESFGQSRVSIIATALIESWSNDERHLEPRVARVIEAFRTSGIQLAHPHLNRGSKDIYSCLR